MLLDEQLRALTRQPHLLATWAEEHPEAVDEFRAVLVTVDPERDNPRLLRTYLDAFDVRFVGLVPSR